MLNWAGSQAALVYQGSGDGGGGAVEGTLNRSTAFGIH